MADAAEAFVIIQLIYGAVFFVVVVVAAIIIRHVLARRFQGNVHILNLISSLVTGILFSAILFFPSLGGNTEENLDALSSALSIGFSPAIFLFIIFEVFAVAHMIAQKIEGK